MATIGERLRGLRGDLAQVALGARLGRNQRWISERERGVVDTSVEDAIEIADALGYAAELVIVPRRHGRILETLTALDPDGAALAMRLAAVWPTLEPGVRNMIEGMVAVAESAALDRPAARRA